MFHTYAQRLQREIPHSGYVHIRKVSNRSKSNAVARSWMLLAALMGSWYNIPRFLCAFTCQPLLLYTHANVKNKTIIIHSNALYKCSWPFAFSTILRVFYKFVISYYSTQRDCELTGRRERFHSFLLDSSLPPTSA